VLIVSWDIKTLYNFPTSKVNCTYMAHGKNNTHTAHIKIFFHALSKYCKDDGYYIICNTKKLAAVSYLKKENMATTLQNYSAVRTVTHRNTGDFQWKTSVLLRLTFIGTVEIRNVQLLNATINLPLYFSMTP
jgi:hypothetical protein